MKKILFAPFALAILFSFGSCKPNDQIMVRFHNTLDSTIENARMEFDETNLTTIGQIPAGVTTDYVAFDYFETGSGMPTGLLKGIQNGEPFSASSGNWCGTGVTYKQLDPGQYTIEIVEAGTAPHNFFRIKFVQ